jgi:transcriptional regulator with XRE-family HTH domain
MESDNTKPRGRPPSRTAGAQEAFDAIEEYRKGLNLSFNELAIRCGLTPSSVLRALADRRTARWTPTLTRIYSIAKNEAVETKISPVMRRLAAYEGPGEAAVKRLLDDVETLITTLTTLRR